MNSDGKALIDHIATSNSIRFTLESTISRTINDGKAISDHPGIIGRLSSD